MGEQGSKPKGDPGSKGKTLLAGVGGLPGLPPLGKRGPSSPRTRGLPSVRPGSKAAGDKGKTVLGLPKDVVAAARDAGSPASAREPARRDAPERGAPAGATELEQRRTVLGLPTDVMAAAREIRRDAAPAPATPAQPAAPAHDPLDDLEIDTEIEGYQPTLHADVQAAAASVTGRHQVATAPSPGESEPLSASSRPTRIETGDQEALLLTTDPALSRTGTSHRRDEVTPVPNMGAYADRDPESVRVRLVGGRQIPGTRYKLIRWLGEGGMGVVYEAEHIDIERRVAMKVLRLDLSQSPDIAKVFRDEARAANRVGSRNIVQIHDFGELPDGRLYFCMELIDGVDLTMRKDEGVEPGELIGILRQVCKALGAAHDAGIVHRDIKPENILLVEDDGRPGMAKIVDFGVAAILGGEGGGSPIAGTPHYMAPEQIAGGDFDGRLDQYAVGCMAYELLAGAPPFDGETLEEVLIAQLHEPPPPLAEVRPDRMVPPALEAVIRRCLAKEAGDRYPSMAELEAALCEAQIAAGLHCAWDDLPLPDVDPERRAYLASNMPSPFAEAPRRPRWLWPLVAVFVALISVTATAAVLGGEPPPAVMSDIDRLTEEARKAAIANRWVIAEAGGATAYQRVRDLEGMDERAATDRASELRSEFADALVNLGDQLWPTEGAKTIAALYYQWAATFDPTNDHARERSLLTDAELAVARQRANDGEFREAERTLAKIARAAATDDSEERKKLLTEALVDDQPGTGLQRALLADALRTSKIVDEEELTEIARAAALEQIGPSLDGSDEDEELLADDSDTDGADDPKETKGKPKGKTKGKGAGKGKTSGKSGGDAEDAEIENAAKDPEKSDALANDGKTALRSGDRDTAETLFHQALSHNSRNVAALAGLSDISFDRGAYQKAVIYAERAVKISGKNKTLRIKLGDAYFAVLRYNDALKQYEKAGEFGESRAEARIAKVKAKLGGG